jgi:uncharacterized protein
MSVVFEWDPRKARANLRQHGIGFSEAVSVFTDPLARIFLDEDHSSEEQREIIIGYSVARRLLLVSFTERVKDRVRIISSRRATRGEQGDYEENVTS